MAIQFVTDIKGRKRKVLMKYTEYLNLVTKAGEYELLEAYNKAKSKKQNFSNAEDVFR